MATPDVEALLARGEVERDSTQRTKAYQAVEQPLVSEVAWIPLRSSGRRVHLWAGLTLDAQGALAVYDTAPSALILWLPTGAYIATVHHANGRAGEVLRIVLSARAASDEGVFLALCML